MNQQSVLVVDDEPHMRRILEIMLQRNGYLVFGAGNGLEALEIVGTEKIDLIITDMRMSVMNGIELLIKLRNDGVDIPVIVITAHGSIETAVTAMKYGASDYILRPFDIDALELTITRLLNGVEIERHNTFLREELDRGWGAFVGTSAAMRRVYDLIQQVAPTKASVLISGETGTGKELASRAIHTASPRNNKLFVPINCAAIPADILEAELFGYEKGAFTGAVKDRIGKFELASGGTIFLDEITEMPIILQVKLLRFLQDNCIEKLGSNQRIQLDVRVIAATNRNPLDAIKDGLLREDLYYRLNVFPIALPPLRQRIEDINDLATHFIAKHSTRASQQCRLEERILNKLTAYAWPGNVRELENMIERALILCGKGEMKEEHFPINGADIPSPSFVATSQFDHNVGSLVSKVEELESMMIEQALKNVEGSKPRAAALLDISERSLWYKIKKYSLKEYF